MCTVAAARLTESSGSITKTGTPLDAPSGVASPASAVSPDSLRADLPPFKRLYICTTQCLAYLWNIMQRR